MARRPLAAKLCRFGTAAPGLTAGEPQKMANLRNRWFGKPFPTLRLLWEFNLQNAFYGPYRADGPTGGRIVTQRRGSLYCVY